MTNTENLALPYIVAAQDQKHVTHNEALRMLDAIVHLTVVSMTETSPPVSPGTGARYIIGASATGAWAGRDGHIAAWQDGAWSYFVPLAGWLAYVEADATLYVWQGSAWGKVNAITELQNASLVGVNTTADATNKLAVSSAASLFSHAGAGHQVKVNKNAAGDTASFLFQTNWSGRAEFGLTGDDAFRLKYSVDGSTFRTAFKVDGDNFQFAPNGENGPVSINLGPHTVNTSFSSGNAAMEISAAIAGDRYAFFDFHASDAQPDYSSRFIRDPGANGSFRIEDVGAAGIALQCTSAAASVGFDIAGSRRMAVRASATEPGVDNAYSLGSASARWSSVWAVNGTIQTSDKRNKTGINPIASDVAASLVRGIDPIFFKWKEGGVEVKEVSRALEPLTDEKGSKGQIKIKTKTVKRAGKRTHAGFLAQDVEQAMKAAGVDFGAWGLEDKDDKDSGQWLRPDQLIPVLWSMVKAMDERITTLETNGQPQG